MVEHSHLNMRSYEREPETQKGELVQGYLQRPRCLSVEFSCKHSFNSSNELSSPSLEHACSCSIVFEPLVTASASPQPAFRPYSRSTGVSPILITLRGSSIPVAAMIRRIMSGAGRPFATSSLVTEA